MCGSRLFVLLERAREDGLTGIGAREIVKVVIFFRFKGGLKRGKSGIRNRRGWKPPDSVGVIRGIERIDIPPYDRAPQRIGKRRIHLERHAGLEALREHPRRT